jgi:putative Mn2+ efflux pump MntP
MDFSTIFIIALALSMDAFAVSIAGGIIIKKQKIYNAVKFGLCFGGFQMLMPVMGAMGGKRFHYFIAGFDHWFAFGLLFIIGIKAIWEAGKMKSIEDRAASLSFMVLINLGLATSMDALAVGLSLAFINVSIVLPVIIIGIITFCMSFSGFFIGSKFGHFFENKVGIAAGIMLIGIGVKILFEHLR